MTNHQHYCRQKLLGHSDPAKRVSDTYNLHKAVDQYGTVGKWLAFRLDDGSSDDVLYDSKQDAVSHQHHNEHFYMFVKMGPASMSVCDAETILSVHRRMYDAGFRMADPDSRTGGPDMIKRTSAEDQFALSRGIAVNLLNPYHPN